MRQLIVMTMFGLVLGLTLAPRTSEAQAPNDVEKRGCCSHHKGVCGCSSGTTQCCDGTAIPLGTDANRFDVDQRAHGISHVKILAGCIATVCATAAQQL